MAASNLEQFLRNLDIAKQATTMTQPANTFHSESKNMATRWSEKRQQYVSQEWEKEGQKSKHLEDVVADQLKQQVDFWRGRTLMLEKENNDIKATLRLYGFEVLIEKHRDIAALDAAINSPKAEKNSFKRDYGEITAKNDALEAKLARVRKALEED